MPSKSATQFIAGKTHSFMVGRDRYESQGQPFFGVRDASRSSISRRKVLKCTRLAFRAVVCAGGVGLPLPRPPRVRQACPRQAPCRSAGASQCMDRFTTGATNPHTKRCRDDGYGAAPGAPSSASCRTSRDRRRAPPRYDSRGTSTSPRRHERLGVWPTSCKRFELLLSP